MYAVSSVKWGVVHDAEVNKNRLEGEREGEGEREKDGEEDGEGMERGRDKEGGRANNTCTCAYLNVYFSILQLVVIWIIQNISLLRQHSC